MKDALITVGVYVSAMLTVAGVAHTFTTGTLRPLAKFNPSKTNDRYLDLAVWWTNAVPDKLQEWALEKWGRGWERAQAHLRERRETYRGADAGPIA